MKQYILYAHGSSKLFTDREKAVNAAYSVANCYAALALILENDEITMKQNKQSGHLLYFENKRLDMIILIER